MSAPTDNLLATTSLYYVPGRWYSFTLCPRDQHETRCNRWQGVCIKLYECVISAFGNYASFRYNVEISEPHNHLKETTIPRIHAHGRFLLYDQYSVLQFLLFGLYNLTQLGVTEVDTIDDLDKWDTYCEKQMEVTKFETVRSTHSEPPKRKKDRTIARPFNYKEKKEADRLTLWAVPSV